MRASTDAHARIVGGLLAALAATLVLASVTVAGADDLDTDGDGLAPVTASNPLAFGEVCLGDGPSQTAIIAVRRVGAGQVYANGATVTVTVDQANGAGLSAVMQGDDTIVLPGDWTGQGNGTQSADTALATVTLDSATAGVGAFAGSVQFDGTGNKDGGGVITRGGNLPVTADVVECEGDPPTADVSTPGDGTTYGQNQEIPADFECDGVDSPIVSCTGTVADGSPIDTAARGWKRFTVVAETEDGDSAQMTVRYYVAEPCKVPPTIVPVNGQTVIEGTPGNDVIIAMANVDYTINGWGGTDIICTGPGADTITGGAGNDIISTGGGPDTVMAGGGNDWVSLGGGLDTALGGAGNDTLLGKPGGDNLTGGAGDDLLMGNKGKDVLSDVDGVEGNDVLNGGPNKDTCSSDPGDAQISCP
ncbi:MAG: hypothetical protein HY658_02345 [Actinobacteria bacterium]|nr:hypothetical protein [Actinomycetota bacterium]